ncbi:MAG TPA: hypothetical protein ENJ11_06970 [Gammaproteobacteria bacterium]|nr:hypothetical protein [Gammaproteobacteria bacterium]
MFARWVLVLLLVVAANAQANRYKTEIIEYIDDVKVVAFISEDDIKNAKQWVPGKQAVPLEIASVIDIISKHAASIEGSKLSILEIELKEIPHHQDYWHYVVKARMEKGEQKNAVFFVILMDGKLIPAMKEPEAIK